MLTLPGKTLICCALDAEQSRLSGPNVDIMSFAAEGGGVDVVAVLQELAARGVNEVLVESGPRLAGYLLDADLVDELVIYQAPHIMGSRTRRLADTPAWVSLADRKSLTISDVRRIGDDTRITATIAKSGAQTD
jgi:diaminohydroxyphosphoribosylaminopyrimidine deaminase/5-amino-6-(5-phosphoribosylamino)uracil reductase